MLNVQQTFAQQIVNDKYKQRQMESMVATRWGDFIPRWYYILFHNKYRKGEDRRNMLQLLPTAAAINITEAQSRQEREDTNEVFKQYLWINTNRTIEPVYHLQFKPKLLQVNLEIEALIFQALQIEVNPSVILTFQTEHIRLKEQVEIIREGLIDQGESVEGYQEILQELTKLKGMIHKYISKQEILNKYSQL